MAYFDISQVVTNKYMRTLALVKQDIGVPECVDNVLEEDTLNLEASSLTKDDKDFKVYMGSGELTTLGDLWKILCCQSFQYSPM